MAMHKVAFEVELPDGYSVVAYRIPHRNDFYLDRHGILRKWTWETLCDETFLILRKVDHWRPAQPEDMIRVIKGEKVVARFRDSEDKTWEEGYLEGWRVKTTHPWYSRYESFVLCEVKE